jgi:hypothetical protein
MLLSSACHACDRSGSWLMRRRAGAWRVRRDPSGVDRSPTQHSTSPGSIADHSELRRSISADACQPLPAPL